MNAARRKRIRDIVDALNDLRQEEQEAHDNLPESLQQSERGEAMERAIDQLDEVVDTLYEVAAT